jgi:hypothetical protein
MATSATKVFRWFPPWKAPRKYSVIEDDSGDEESLSYTREKSNPVYQVNPQRQSQPIFWIVSTFFFAGLSLWLVARDYLPSHYGSFARGYSTEFGTHIVSI